MAEPQERQALFKRPSFGNILEAVKQVQGGARNLFAPLHTALAQQQQQQQQEQQQQQRLLQAHLQAVQIAQARVINKPAGMAATATGPLVRLSALPLEAEEGAAESPKGSPKDSSAADRRRARLRRNAEAAKRIRRRKKEYVEGLKVRVDALEQENAFLKQELAKIKAAGSARSLVGDKGTVSCAAGHKRERRRSSVDISATRRLV